MSRKKAKQEEQPIQPISGMTKDDGVSLIPRVADPPSEQVAEPDEAPDNSVFEGSLFEGLYLPESGTNLTATRLNDGLPALDSDLTEDEKKQFVALLNKEMSLADRAKQLALLARMKGTKTAAVGLRAIQEINSLCGLRDNKPTEAAPMFVLPDEAKVAILVQKVER